MARCRANRHHQNSAEKHSGGTDEVLRIRRLLLFASAHRAHLVLGFEGRPIPHEQPRDAYLAVARGEHQRRAAALREEGRGVGERRRSRSSATERGAAHDDGRRASRDGGGGGKSVSRRTRRGAAEDGRRVRSSRVGRAPWSRRPTTYPLILVALSRSSSSSPASRPSPRAISPPPLVRLGDGGRRGGGLAERERRGGGVSARRTSRAAAFTSAPLSTRSCAMGAWPACAANLHRGWRVSHNKEVGLFTTTRNRRSAVAHARRTNMSGVVQPTRLGLFITTRNRHLAVVRIRGERT